MNSREITDLQHVISMGITYLRVFRYRESLKEFCRRTPWGFLRQNQLENGADPTPEELAKIREIHYAWKPDPPYGPGNKL